MASCCDPGPYEELFDHREAERRLRRFRKKGLDGMARRLLDFMVERGVEGRSVFEVGGGLGDFQVELLRAGADSSVNVELSAAYEEAANRLLRSEGLVDRVERHTGDFVERREDFPIADIVVLNRVICCYPWADRMMEAATTKTGWLLAIAVPRDRWVSRWIVAVGNRLNALRTDGFRAFVHPVRRLEAIADGAGLTPVFLAKGLIWQGMVFEHQS